MRSTWNRFPVKKICRSMPCLPHLRKLFTWTFSTCFFFNSVSLNINVLT